MVSYTRDRPFVVIPVFPSRFFRHSGIYVSAESGIEKPGDLVGKRVGLAEYQLTANVWIRGILADEHDVPVESVSYHAGGMHEAGRPEKLKVGLPDDVRIEPIGAAETLSDLFAEGAIDGPFTLRAPRTFDNGPGRVRRLFESSGPAE